MDLIDVTNIIIPDENPKYFNEEEAFDLYQMCLYLMEEFIKNHPKLITEQDFEDIFNENIEELMHAHFDYDIFYTDEAEEEMEEIMEQAKKDFYKDFMPPRSYPNSIILQKPNYSELNKQIDILRSKPQPVQRTDKWYEFRQNLITASNAYKVFESQCVQNQLIYEKCKDTLNNTKQLTNEIVVINVNTTLHWGQKYEPLSVMIYEELYKTKIEDFGCIQHDKYKFIGASPDGINIDMSSDRYGRMLEIKNIVNREIDGIPKKEYWIQMQLQMEVCNLPECDFLETKFIEIEKQEFLLDCMDVGNNNNVTNNVCLSKDNKFKGYIVHFHTKEGTPFYAYKPLKIVSLKEIEEWENDIIEKYEKGPYNYTYIKTIYWKLDLYSCVLVTRNQFWFESNVQEIQTIWNIILKERKEGFEHRGPNKKIKKEMENKELDLMNKQSKGCLLHYFTITKKEKEQNYDVNGIKKFELELELDLKI
jgi:putative phage-type endonuclease